MQRQEIPNHTHEQIVEHIVDALELVETLNPPDDLRVAVFTQAASLYAGKQIIMQQPQPIDLGNLNRAMRRQ